MSEGLRSSRDSAFTSQEVEVESFIGLTHMLDVQVTPATAASGDDSWGPACWPHIEGFVGDLDMRRSARHIHADEVAGADQGERPTHSSLGHNVQDDRPVGGPAHAGIRDPDHVGETAFENLL